MRGVLFVILLAGCAHTKPDSRLPDYRAIGELAKTFSTSHSMPERLEVEGQLPLALERAGLLNLAFIYTVPPAKAEAHPHHAAMLSALVRLQERRRDDFLVPSIFNHFVLNGMKLKLSEQDAARVAWFRARIAFRKGQLEEASSLCAQVPASSPVFERAEYVRAIALSALRADEALPILERLTSQARDEGIKAQATLALARLAYGHKRWADSRRWYGEAARFDSTRAVALVEQGWALIQLGDWKAVNWTETRDEAQLSGLYEAPLLDALAAHYSGDGWEAESRILNVHKWDGAPKIDWTQESPERAFEAITTERGLSVDQLRRLKRNVRLMDLVALAASFDSELETVNSIAEWRQNGVAQEFSNFLIPNRDTLRRAAGDMALRELAALQAEKEQVLDASWLLGVEVALARKDVGVAILRLERMIQRVPKGSSVASELWFRLAAVHQAEADAVRDPKEIAESREAVERSIKHVLEGDPSYERLEEARRFLTSP